MTETEKVFKLAIEREKEANALYNEAASKTTDINSKKVYMWLAQEETRHKVLLNLELNNYSKNGKCLAIESIEDVKLETPIQASEFPWLPEKTAEPDADALEIMQQALQAEIEALKFYKDIAESTSDLTTRGVLNELARIEAGHVALLDQQCKWYCNCNAMFMLGRFETPLGE